MHSLPILVLLLMSLALPALADEGVLEINQTCATQTGCFAGDAAGFPVTISASGSYRLTSNLDYPSATADAVTISASDVAIDLNGNTIKGTNTCTVSISGWVTSCSQPNAGGAIVLISGVRHLVTDGRVLGARGIGIFVGEASEVRHVQVSDCSGQGILVGSRSSISSVSAIGNGVVGIEAGNISFVRDSVVTNNLDTGILVGRGSTVSGNTAGQNGGGGILVDMGSTVSGNTTYLNNNDGILAGHGATVWGNTVRQNAGFGLRLFDHSGYRENVISGNTGGTVTGTNFVNLGSNACNGSPICP